MALAVLLALSLGLFVRYLIFQPFYVSEHSMAPELQKGDRVLCSRLSYGVPIPFLGKVPFGFQKPEKGNLITFRHPLTTGSFDIKRIVAQSGDILDIKKKHVRINGRIHNKEAGQEDSISNRSLPWDPRENFAALRIPSPGDTLRFSSLSLKEFEFAVNLLRQEQPGQVVNPVLQLFVDNKQVDLNSFLKKLNLDLPPGKETLSLWNWYEIETLLGQVRQKYPLKTFSVGKGVIMNDVARKFFKVKNTCYFVMGDNDNTSYDSRYWGYLSQRAIHSKPLFIYWSKKPNGLFKVNFNRIFKFLS